jgi:hypothetical protein
MMALCPEAVDMGCASKEAWYTQDAAAATGTAMRSACGP